MSDEGVTALAKEGREVAPHGARKGKYAAELARRVGISTRKMERLLAVKDHATPELYQEVMDNKRTINSAYNLIMARRQKNPLAEYQKAVKECVKALHRVRDAQAALRTLAGTEELNSAIVTAAAEAGVQAV